MIFSPESVDVFYLWDGKCVNLIHVAPHEGKNENWYWPGNTVPDQLPDAEVKILNEVAATKRKTVFLISKKGRRYTVRQRGVFEYTNIQSDAGS